MISANSVASVVLATAPVVGNAESLTLQRTSVSLAETATTVAEISDAVVMHEQLFKFELDGWCPEYLEISNNVKLKMRQVPELFLSYATSTFRIPSWGVSVSQASDMPMDKELVRQMKRQFSRLVYAARRQTLSAADRELWRQMLQHIDYGDYCEQTAPCMWVIGRRVKATDDGVVIAWESDGQEEVCGNLAKDLSYINDGETFTALAKFRNFKLSEIKEITPIQPVHVESDDLSWIS